MNKHPENAGIPKKCPVCPPYPKYSSACQRWHHHFSKKCKENMAKVLPGGIFKINESLYFVQIFFTGGNWALPGFCLGFFGGTDILASHCWAWRRLSWFSKIQRLRRTNYVKGCFNTPLEHTPGNPPSQLWKKPLFSLFGEGLGVLKQPLIMKLWIQLCPKKGITPTILF